MSSPCEREEVLELLGAFALDAVEPHEATLVEAHLDVCFRCRAEVDSHRELTAALALSLEEPPAHLWDRIAATLPPQRVPPRHGSMSTWPPSVTGVEASPAPSAARLPRRFLRRWVRPAAVAAAAAAIALLGFRVAQLSDQLDQSRHALQQTGAAAGFEAALKTPGHRVVTLVSADGRFLAEVVYLSNGRGYLSGGSLPRLPGNETYQLWAFLDGRPISIGLLGARPADATFTVAGTGRPSALAVTAEPVGGVATPDRTPVASGTVST